MVVGFHDKVFTFEVVPKLYNSVNNSEALLLCDMVIELVRSQLMTEIVNRSLDFYTCPILDSSFVLLEHASDSSGRSVHREFNLLLRVKVY